MKKASPIHVLLHKPLLLTAVVVITLIGAFVVVGQASRYAAHGKEWWFEGVSSCNAFMTFLYLAMVAIYGNISTRNSETEPKELLRPAVLLSVAYSIGMGTVLSPVLVHYGFKWYNLCATLVYVIGFVNLCLVPFFLGRNWKAFLLAACPLILFSVIDWLCENNNMVSVAALTLIGLVSAGVLWKKWLPA